MYNLYTYEKNKHSQFRQNNHPSVFSKSKINYERLKNFNKRIKQFILNSAQKPEKLKVQDFQEPIKSSREEYFEDTKDLIKGRKGFHYGNFQSEKERIRNTVSYNKLLFGYLESPINKLEKQSKMEDNMNKKTPQNQDPINNEKTYLDKILSSMNQNNYYPKVQKFFRSQNEDSKLEGNDQNLSFIRKTNSMKDINNIRTINKSKPFQKYISNKNAYKIRTNLENKTYFKAIMSIANNKNYLNDILKSNNNKTIQKMHSKPSDNFNSYISEEYKETKSNEIEYKLNKSRSTEDLLFLKFGIPYRKNKNPISEKSIQKEDNIIKSMNELKELAFGKDTLIQQNKEQQDEKKEDEYKNECGDFGADYIKKKKNEIIIEGQIYNLSSQMDIISQKILKNCNIYHEKNKNCLPNLKLIKEFIKSNVIDF